MKYILRIIILPFWAMVALIHSLTTWGKHCCYFILYGGEAISYSDKNKRKTIYDIYCLLEEEHTKLKKKEG